MTKCLSYDIILYLTISKTIKKEKMITRTVTLIMLMLLSTFSYSYATDKELTLIRGGSDTGMSAQRSNLYTVSLEGKGYVVNRPASMPDKQIVEFFNNTKQPVIWPGTTDYGARMDLDFSSENLVAIEYTGLYYMCYTGNRTNTKQIKLGIPKSAPKTTLDKLGYKTTFPYKNNGATVRAAIAGEVEAVVVNQKSANKLKSAGMKCEEFGGFNQVAFLLARNIEDLDQFRKDVAGILSGPEFSEWQNKAGLLNDSFTGDVDKDYNTVKTSWNIWANQ